MRFHNSSAEEGACVGLKPDLQEGTRFNLLRVQFWTPCRKRVPKGSKKWTLNQNWSPLEGPVLVPFLDLHCRKLLKRLFQVEADLISSSCGWNLELEAHFCVPACLIKQGPSLSHCFAPISIALRPSRPASKLAPKCFVLIPMVSRRWSSRLALRPASNYNSSSKLFVWLQFPYPWGLEACVEAVSLRQLRA